MYFFFFSFFPAKCGSVSVRAVFMVKIWRRNKRGGLAWKREKFLCAHCSSSEMREHVYYIWKYVGGGGKGWKNMKNGSSRKRKIILFRNWTFYNKIQFPPPPSDLPDREIGPLLYSKNAGRREKSEDWKIEFLRPVKEEDEEIKILNLKNLRPLLLYALECLPCLESIEKSRSNKWRFVILQKWDSLWLDFQDGAPPSLLSSSFIYNTHSACVHLFLLPSAFSFSPKLFSQKTFG